MPQNQTPIVTIGYGVSGHGKTLDLVYSFPNALFIPINEDSVRGSDTVCGYTLRQDQVVPCWTLSTALALLVQVRDEQRKQGRILYPQVVVDDLSMLAKHQLKAMKDSGRYTEGSGFNYSLWTDLADMITDFITLARHELGADVAINAHERPPENKDGVSTMGGPLLPSRKLTAEIPHAATSVYRTGIEKGREPWVGVYKNDPSNRSWYMKCRLNYTGTIPMNMAELWRGAGHHVGRHPDLAWMEPYVKAVALKLSEGEKLKTVGKKVVDRLSDKDPRHIRWVLRDGIDRHLALKSRRDNILSFIR